MFQNCSRVLLPENLRERYLSSCSNPNLEYIQKKQLRKAVHKFASRMHICPYCSSVNGSHYYSLGNIFRVRHQGFQCVLRHPWHVQIREAEGWWLCEWVRWSHQWKSRTSSSITQRTGEFPCPERSHIVNGVFIMSIDVDFTVFTINSSQSVEFSPSHTMEVYIPHPDSLVWI